MPLLTLHDVSLSFAGPPLLDRVGLQIEDGERLGLLGRNGAGKSTLLRVLEGALPPADGEVVRAPHLRVASLPQDVPGDLVGRVGDYLHHACGVTASDRAWEIESRIDRVVREFSLDPGAEATSLSAGTRRRVLLAAALVREPDLLLLDEPTNHLDVDTIELLEETLLRRRGALVFVTHDRGFLRRIATRILDLDRGVLRSYRTSYDAYVEQREDERRVEAEQARSFDRRLAQEEAWLRRGIKARRTRNEGRVRALEALREERRARREEPAAVQGALQEADRSGRKVMRIEDLSWSWGETPIVTGFTTTILRGDRIGVLGPNGCGKTTLLSLLLGRLAPQAGSVTHGTRLEVAEFEQLHDSLDPARSVADNVGEGRETIVVNGAERHVVGYLHDFRFTTEQIRGPVHRLSGGERRRLQLARVLSRPCNLLVLDEPTNDLDLETLELLEGVLEEFTGTLFVVSHDRAFLDNVVTSTLVCEGGGRWREYVGGHADWLRQRPARPARTEPGPSRPRPERASAEGAGPAKPRKLGFREQRDLAELPARIEALENERHALFERLGSPDLYARRGDEVAALQSRLEGLEQEIQTAWARWLELEARASDAS